MKLFPIIIACSLLSACGPQVPIQTTPTQVAVENGLSCTELTSRNARVDARLKELEVEGNQQARTSALTNAALNIGFGALIGGSVRGGADAIRAASTLGNGMSAVLAAESGRNQMGNVTDTLALARRSAELQRAMIEQGC